MGTFFILAITVLLSARMAAIQDNFLTASSYLKVALNGTTFKNRQVRPKSRGMPQRTALLGFTMQPLSAEATCSSSLCFLSRALETKWAHPLSTILPGHRGAAVKPEECAKGLKDHSAQVLQLPHPQLSNVILLVPNQVTEQQETFLWQKRTHSYPVSCIDK